MKRVSSYVCAQPCFMCMCMLSYLMVSKTEDIIYLPHECWKDQQTHICQSAMSSLKRWTWRIYFLFSCWACIFSGLAGTWFGKAESGLSGAMNDHGMQRCQMTTAGEGLGTEVLFTLDGCGVMMLAEEIPLQVFQLSAVACTWPNMFLGTSLPLCRNLWSRTPCRWQK